MRNTRCSKGGSARRPLQAQLFSQTLEPCTTCNHPKIPCAERVLDRRFKRVFIGMLDPNKEISGKGEQRLRDARIETVFFDANLMEVLDRD